jgi:hypothetical protein
MYGCRTDGTPQCASSCPTNQSLCGGTSCVDIYSTALHCGTSCTHCMNSTAQCYQGGCVQCLADADCLTSAHSTLGSHAVCYQSPSHNCGCAKQDPNNVLTNPGFDSNASGWTTQSGAAISRTGGDGYGCSLSQCAAVTGFLYQGGGIQQCARITAGLTYNFGAMDDDNGASSPFTCSVEYHGSAGCGDGNPLGFDAFQGTPGASGWTSLGGPTTAPAGAVYALVSCQQFDGGSAYVDQLYLNATNDSY